MELFHESFQGMELDTKKNTIKFLPVEQCPLMGWDAKSSLVVEFEQKNFKRNQNFSYTNFPTTLNHPISNREKKH